jgi:hypothetical protein
MVGLTITETQLQPCGRFLIVQSKYTITQADIDAGSEHRFSYSERSKGNDVTDISGTTVTNDVPYGFHYTTPSILL